MAFINILTLPVLIWALWILYVCVMRLKMVKDGVHK